MSVADGLVPIESARRKPMLREATALVWMAALAGFLLVSQQVIDAGYLRGDVATLLGGEPWRNGGWLSQLMLSLVGLIPRLDWQQTMLSLTAAVVAGLSFGLLYDRLRINGWTILGCLVLLVALGSHAGVLYAISAASAGLPLYFAFAVLIPAIRQMEEVGDVQSSIGLGLLMPLLLLAGPLTTPLILPLALGAALADPDGRRDPRAFVAMLLVAVLPAIIVAIGVLGFAAQAGIGVETVLVPYIATYGQIGLGDIAGSLTVLATLAPVLVVPLAYCLWPNLPEKRHSWSALAVVALPVYLAIARVGLNGPMQSFVPAVALLAAYASWLSVVRLPPMLRFVALLMLVVSVVLSWTQTGIWDDPAWKQALFGFLPDDIAHFGLRPGM